MVLNSAWVRNPTVASGQDHLGVRAPSEYVYTYLMPGITNVTSRARYYSFYTWLFRAIELHQGNLRTHQTFDIIRRADCLFSMVGIFHHNLLGRPDDNLHTGFTGWRTLAPIVARIHDANTEVRISDYTGIDDADNRYFMNKLGGLGQYYVGPLLGAAILDRDDTGNLVYTEDRGLPLCEAVDDSVNREAFFDALEEDVINAQTLQSLSGFCACQLEEAQAEREALSMFFLNDGPYNVASSERRPDTLHTILELCRRFDGIGDSIPVSDAVGRLLETAYRRSLATDKPLSELPSSMVINLDGWRQYYANEFLGIAVQTLFWAALSTLSERELTVSDSASFGEWFRREFESVSDYKLVDLEEAVRTVRSELPSITDWDSERHECFIVRDLIENVAYRADVAARPQAVSDAIRLLISIAARWGGESEHELLCIPLPPGYEETYPVNLPSFFRLAEERWTASAVSEWMKWLAVEWGLETHLRIALRKLRYEGLDTFKIIPTENGLRIIEPAGNQTISDTLRPGYTNPRLRESMQMLHDIGALEIQNGCYVVTDYGNSLLEAKP